MDKQSEYIEDFQKSGMNTPEHYIDLTKYESIYDIEEEIKKLQQDKEIRRNVRQKMGENGDDEKILIIEEKIKLLEVEKKKKIIDRKESLGFVFFILALLSLPAFILQPILLPIPITILIIVLLVRKARRDKHKPNEEKRAKNKQQ